MTALTMTPRHANLSQRGIKTQTRRVRQPGERLGLYARADGQVVKAVFHASGRVRWYVGCVRAIKTARIGRAVGWVQVVDLREARLGDITEADATAEGYGADTPGPAALTAIARFAAAWDDINGAGAFARNPDVWVIVYERVEA